MPPRTTGKRPTMKELTTKDRSRPKQQSPIRDNVEACLTQLCGGTIERLSFDGCRRTGARLGLLFHNGLRKRRDIAVTNVRLAFPELSEARAQQIARRSAQNFAMTFCEFLHLRRASSQEIQDYVDWDGLEHVHGALAQGRGMLLLTAHLGNWEAMGARAAQEIPIAVVARPSTNKGLEEYVLEVRRAAGFKVISKFDTGRASLGVLRSNSALGILPDQYAWPDGPLFPMFGHATRFTTAVARLSLLSRAPIVPMFGVRRTPWLADGRIIIRVSPSMALERKPGQREAEIREGTLRIIREIEDIVRQYPEQWLWMHRRWRWEDITEPDEAAANGAREAEGDNGTI